MANIDHSKKSQLNKTSTIANPASQPPAPSKGFKKGESLNKVSALNKTSTVAAPASANPKKTILSNKQEFKSTSTITAPASVVEKGTVVPKSTKTQFLKPTTTTSAPEAGRDSVKSGPKITQKSNLQRTSLW
jgi:hypothetical protein